MGIVAPWSEPDTIHWPIQGWKGAPFNPFCQSCLGQELQSFVRVDPCRQQARRLASGASAWLLHHTHSTSLAVDRCRYVCVSHSLSSQPNQKGRRGECRSKTKLHQDLTPPSLHLQLPINKCVHEGDAAIKRPTKTKGRNQTNTHKSSGCLPNWDGVPFDSHRTDEGHWPHADGAMPMHQPRILTWWASLSSAIRTCVCNTALSFPVSHTLYTQIVTYTHIFLYHFNIQNTKMTLWGWSWPSSPKSS
jgi:hypothetical protein